MNERQFAEAVLFATFVGIPMIGGALFCLCMLFEAAWKVWCGAIAVMIAALLAPLAWHSPEGLPIKDNPLLLPLAAYGLPAFAVAVGWLWQRHVAADRGNGATGRKVER